jgi:hypothetical protein
MKFLEPSPNMWLCWSHTKSVEEVDLTSYVQPHLVWDRRLRGPALTESDCGGDQEVPLHQWVWYCKQPKGGVSFPTQICSREETRRFLATRSSLKVLWRHESILSNWWVVIEETVRFLAPVSPVGRPWGSLHPNSSWGDHEVPWYRSKKSKDLPWWKSTPSLGVASPQKFTIGIESLWSGGTLHARSQSAPLLDKISV